jgi:phage repressor protein C with HTH and peptisase S24 domain
VARPLTSSFDPDASDPVEPFDAEAPPAIDPDAHPRIPVRGIVEIDATAGMGEGQVLAHMYRRDGREIRTVDAIKPQAWLFPEWFLARMPPPEHLFAVLAEGDSMSPTIPSGAVVFVDTRRTRPSPEGIYAIRDRYGAIQIKRIRTFGQPIGRMLVVSDKDGQGESVSMDDYAIVGFMVGKMTLD